MDIIKLFVGKEFARVRFVKVLEQIGVPARAVNDGIILNRDLLKKVPPYLMPHWVWLNMEDINSIFHTRPSSLQELYGVEEIG